MTNNDSLITNALKEATFFEYQPAGKILKDLVVALRLAESQRDENKRLLEEERFGRAIRPRSELFGDEYTG